MEKIISIETIYGHKPNIENCKDSFDPSKLGLGGMLAVMSGDYKAYDGLLIKTDDQEIFVGVDNNESCCESWGYVTSEDDLNQFIGAEIRNITRVDEGLKSTNLALDKKYLDEGGAMFINIETTKGLFQIAAYNSHNGYYGHTAVLVSKQLSTNQGV